MKKIILTICLYILVLINFAKASTDIEELLEKCADLSYVSLSRIDEFKIGFKKGPLIKRDIDRAASLQDFVRDDGNKDELLSKYQSNKFSLLVLESSEYKKNKKDIDDTKMKKKNIETEFQLRLDKWVKDNPGPKRSDYTEVTTGLDTVALPQYSEDLIKWKNSQKKHMLELDKQRKFIKIKLKELMNNNESIIRSVVNDYVINESLSLKTKARTLYGYFNYYTDCEIKYNATPHSFMLEWQD
tara:strand:+ start:35 stop:763 length:729 start_codon:yes stop_codon:yes gene_type:complete